MEFKERMLELVQAHKERLIMVLTIEDKDYYFLTDQCKNNYWFLYWIYKEVDVEEVQTGRCQYCALRELCKTDSEFCEDPKFSEVRGKESDLFITYQDWTEFLNKMSLGYLI